MFLLILALLVSRAGTLETELTVEHLGDDVIFDIAWPGRLDLESAGSGGHVHSSLESSQDPMESPPAIHDHKLPNELLGPEKVVHSESVVMTTIDREKYTCVLPKTSIEENEEDDELIHSEAYRPDTLLAPLLDKCCGLSLGYWNYELCHGSYLKQYHEDKLTNGQTKLTEYYLGIRMLLKPASSWRKGGQGEEEQEGGSEQITNQKEDSGNKQAPPTWYFNGVEYPYHQVELVDGTPCDLLGTEPRSTKVLYICEQNAHETGSLLHIEEVHTCKYEAVVATKHLCQSKTYRLRDNPVSAIQCYPDTDSPSRPRMLREHELLSSLLLSRAKPTSSQPMTAQRGSEGAVVTERAPKPVAPDTDFIHGFLSGECLRGGTGWWEHEICFGKHVQQTHTEGRAVVDVVKLGVWDEEAHKSWFSNAGKRKQSKGHVIHLYVNGDVCDVTGVARTCQVKYKCVKAFSSSQVSLYLEETTTCSYILTVEGKFVCDLLESTDQYGMFQYSSSSNSAEEAGKSDGSTAGRSDDSSSNAKRIDSR